MASGISAPPRLLRRLRHRRAAAARLHPAPLRGGALAVLQDLLIGEDADQDDRSHDREVERARNAEQVDEVLQHLEQIMPRRRPPSSPRRRAASSRRARRRDGVELVESACTAGEIERVYMAMKIAATAASPPQMT